ncbi:MAG: hypothetical protein LQ351_005394 [Letrouitia transgressa]|nr:MAG: hypothetical protein LQ351_005394 [Letrouitia transgressa]
MALHPLAVAKVSLSAALLKRDPDASTSDGISEFCRMTEAVLEKCLYNDIEVRKRGDVLCVSELTLQPCTKWLSQNVVSSVVKTCATIKYLNTVSGLPQQEESYGMGNKPLSTHHKQLHALYIVNDLLHWTKHWTKFRTSRKIDFKVFEAEETRDQILELVKSGAAHEAAESPKHHVKLYDLIEIWDNKGYFDSSYIQLLHETLGNSALSDYASLDKNLKEGEKDEPWVMPSSHGEYSTAYYDLPAGNWLPHIVPNSTAPIDPKKVKPLQFAPGPAPDILISAVEDLLAEADEIYKLDTNIDGDIDELGQPIIPDETNEDKIKSGSYYGWSKPFCEKMKKRHKVGLDAIRERPDDETLNFSRSLWSHPDESSVNQKAPALRRADHPSQPDPHLNTGRRPRSATRSYSPPEPASAPQDKFQMANSPSQFPGGEGAFRPSFTMNFPPEGFLGPDGQPIPPPRPRDYSGPWPPPPPLT